MPQARVATAAAIDDEDARPPAGERVRVRVVNASNRAGIARRATLLLRDFGYDVVDFDTERRQLRDTTEIVVHTGHDDWGARVRRAMGVGATVARPESLRFVDVTVLIGRDWTPPAQPLRP